MGPADALSRRDDINTSNDNQSSSILPDPVVINALDLALSQTIAQSSSSDPLVLRVLSALQDGSPLFSRSSTADWTFDNGHLYFKGRMYVPPSARSSLLHAVHSSPTMGHMGIFRTKALLERDYWWPGLSSFVKHFIDGCAVCQQNKVNTHPTVPPPQSYLIVCLLALQTTVYRSYHRPSPLPGPRLYCGHSRPRAYEGGNPHSLLQDH